MKHEKGQMIVFSGLKDSLYDLSTTIAATELKWHARALGVCCGGRMMYYDHQDPRVIFCDNRETHTVLCDGRSFDVCPDVLCDFRSLPFGDETAPLVIFDPPHLRKAGDSSWLAQELIMWRRSSLGRVFSSSRLISSTLPLKGCQLPSGYATSNRS